MEILCSKIDLKPYFVHDIIKYAFDLKIIKYFNLIETYLNFNSSIVFHLSLFFCFPKILSISMHTSHKKKYEYLNIQNYIIIEFFTMKVNWNQI